MTITSRSNPIIIDTAALSMKKHRDANDLFIIEGSKLFCEAISRGVSPERVFVTRECAHSLERELAALQCEVFTVSDSVYEKLSGDHSPDGVLCTARRLHALHDLPEPIPQSPFILCDMQDAGNLGTCIRTALAMGISPLVLAGDCADIYNRKTVRASMGALFSQRIVRFVTHAEAIAYCRDAGFRVYGAALAPCSLDVRSLPDPSRAVFAVGNEGHGLPDGTLSLCDATAIIPMKGDCESLNVSAAAAILMWITSDT